MFGKVKKWLGIEGVKLELVLPDMAFEEVGAVSGKVRFYSKNAQTVTRIRLVMIETYSRGRGKERLVDEYLLGEITLDQRINVPVDEQIEIDFTLPFESVKSGMDEFGDKNLLTGGLAKLAKTISNVQSAYRIEAEAKVEGTALNPFDRKIIKLIGIR
ncbi:MAG: sporulation protein [Lewinellaceae bacterium]|nr:sporulation protein [Saprospiraceae bacterium]MCB9337653.1 sporulation protein [Lewinellaceae bacterium]